MNREIAFSQIKDWPHQLSGWISSGDFGHSEGGDSLPLLFLSILDGSQY